MNRFGSSIFVCGLFVCLAQFALLSEGGLFDCFKPKTSGEGTSRSSRARPDIPADLQHLSSLKDRLTDVNQNLYATINFIPPESLSDCAGHYIKREFGATISRERFEELVREKILGPCQRLDFIVAEWYNRVKYESFNVQPDPWYFPVRICNEILVQRADTFIENAYAYVPAS